MQKRIAITQSNYIPWKGYFDLISRVDELVLYDDRQFTRRDWRNRNQIKTRDGLVWLTIPVVVKGRYTQSIEETRISDVTWPIRHRRMLDHAYSRAPHFEEIRDILAPAYEAAASVEYLSIVNELFLRSICDVLGTHTEFRWSREYPATGSKSERLISICRSAGATHYLSGPTARAYIEEDLFRAAGITLEYMDYSSYPEYPQLHPPFVHTVSIVDVLFNVGSANARAYVTGTRHG